MSKKQQSESSAPADREMSLAEKKHQTGHRQRLRDRFHRQGLSGLADYEVLELLLMYAIPRRDVKPLAKELLYRFGSIDAVFDAEFEALTSVDGMGESAALLIMLLRQVPALYFEKGLLRASGSEVKSMLADFLRMKLGSLKRETMLAVFFTSSHQMAGFQMFSGTVDRVPVYMREIAERGLKLGAVEMLLAHNHPSGNMLPSQNDVQTTEMVKAALGMLGIKLLDHVVVSNVEIRSVMYGKTSAGFFG